MIFYELRSDAIQELYIIISKYIEENFKNAGKNSYFLSDLLRIQEECNTHYMDTSLHSISFKNENNYLSMYCCMLENYFNETTPNAELVLLLEFLYDFYTCPTLSKVIYVDFSNGRTFASEAEMNRSKINIVKS